MQPIIAIDPGASGGIAYCNHEGIIRAVAMPETFGDIRDFFLSLKAGQGSYCAYLELVGGFIGKDMPGSRMFNFGEGYGFLQGVLMALDIPVTKVRPQLWQSALHLGKKGKNMSKTEWKNVLKGEAQQLYPHLKVTLKTADALLILKYAEKELRGKSVDHLSNLF